MVYQARGVDEITLEEGLERGQRKRWKDKGKEKGKGTENILSSLVVA